MQGTIQLALRRDGVWASVKRIINDKDTLVITHTGAEEIWGADVEYTIVELLVPNMN
jgi:hypothetical protein